MTQEDLDELTRNYWKTQPEKNTLKSIQDSDYQAGFKKALELALSMLEKTEYPLSDMRKFVKELN